MSRPLGVAVVGLGFMGRQHVASYAAANEQGQALANRLVAVCDPDPERRAGVVPRTGNAELDGAGDERLFEAGSVTGYAQPAELFADPHVELVSICTYTDTHVDLALAALAAGKHVLVEKPVALAAADIERLAAAARAADGLLCMPAMCIRFWPGWRWLRDVVLAGELGDIQRATIQRRAPVPGWGLDFYADAARTGGALVDLHIHDADFVRWCFGPPGAVHTTGDINQLTTRYLYPDGPEVEVTGAWLDGDDATFFMGFTVEGSLATADYAFGRDPVLQLERDGTLQSVPLPAGTGYDGEIQHLLATLAAGRTTLDATLDEAAALADLLAAERRSLQSGHAEDVT